MRSFIFAFLIVFVMNAQAQEMATLSGFVRDRANKETLPYANIYIPALKIGSATTIEGYFAIPSIPEGVHTVQVSLLGYQTSEFTIDTRRTKRLVQDVYLTDKAVQVTEVVIDAEKEQERRATQTGRIVMQAKDIVSLPTIGEADVFRALQLMPGVKATSEISSGFNVRGGSTDQNLILLDNTVVYNPSHLFGFFSTFNTDAVKDIDLMKGGFPAEYGGRLSSVLNVTNIDGDRVNTHGKASISLLSSRLTGEGPLGNGSWFLSGRRTYLDQVVSIARLDTGKDALPLYYFYDANLKINQDLSDDDKVSFVGYLGQDDLLWKLGENELSINMRWGNRTSALKWTHLFSQTLFSNITASYSRYLSTTDFNFGGVRLAQSNSIDDYSIRADVDFFAAQDHLVKLGVWWSQYRVTYSQTGDGEPYEFLERPAQISFYAQDEWRYDERWTFQFGLRTEYQDLSKHVTTGPRLNVRFNIDDLSSVKLASGMYYQFLMAVPAGSDNGFSPFDIWIPINERMNPSRAIDIVAGYENRYLEDVSLSLEAYYKTFREILYFRNEITYTKEVDQLFFVGDGEAFGTELFLQKKAGPWTGTLGYTLAWTYRTFDMLNGGEKFQPKFDRRHDLTMTVNFQADESWRFGAVFTYATGQAYTTGVARYEQNPFGAPIELTLPGKLFNQRLSPYHRMDLSVTKRTTFFGLHGSWYFQIYNVYNRRNVWFKQFDNSKNPAEITDVTLLPILPTFGIDFSF